MFKFTSNARFSPADLENAIRRGRQARSEAFGAFFEARANTALKNQASKA